MKKNFFTWGGIVIILVGALLGSGYWIISNVDEYNKTEGKAEEKEPATKGTSYESAEEEYEAQTGSIGGIEYEIDPVSLRNEENVIDIMHKMTHQKVAAEEKWGAVPMTDDTVNSVYEAVSNSNFERKADMIDILEKWKNEDFNTVANDHNYFWNLQGGTIGKAYGTLDYNEELEFIHNNFDIQESE